MNTSKILRAVIPMLTAASFAQAATILNDTFSDGDRTTQDLPNSAAYYFGTSSANGTVAVASNALKFNYATTADALTQVVTYFTPAGSPITLSIGDTLSASFTFSGTNIANITDSLRIGLYNSGGTRVSADTTGIANSAFNNHTGYGIWTNLNASGTNTTDLVQRSGASTTLFAGSAHSNILSSSAALGYAANTTYTLTFSLTYTSASGVLVKFSDSKGNLISATDTTSPYTTFDTFALFLNNGSSVNAYTIDNVAITTTTIPEPGTYALMMAGLAGLSILARKRAAKL